MTLSDKLTRDQVRDAFNRNLTYADLCGIDIRALQGFIAIECARHDRKLASKGELLMLMQPSCLKKHAPNISASTERVDELHARHSAQCDCRPGGIRCRAGLLGGISWDFSNALNAMRKPSNRA